jgi:hypothetical protein
MKKKSPKQILQDYFFEIYNQKYSKNTIELLDILIKSHRFLRKLNLENEEAKRQTKQEAYRDAYNYWHKIAKEENWIEIDKLRKMTVAELVDYLCGFED